MNKRDLRHGDIDVDMEGWLHKWTNYIKGYRRRWFVLSKGLLSYYRKPTDVHRRCRGNIPVANVIIHTEDTLHIIISNGRKRTLHLRAANESDRQRWTTALELAKARLNVDSDEDDDNMSSQDLNSQDVLNVLTSKLDDLKTCHELNVKQAASLSRALSELESIEPENFHSKVASIAEKSALFKMTSQAIIEAADDYLSMASTHGRRWQKLLTNEHEARLRLEEMIEQLAKQHSHLEQRARASMSITSSVGHLPIGPSDEEEFFDAVEEFFRRASMSSSSGGQFHSPTSNPSSDSSSGLRMPKRHGSATRISTEVTSSTDITEVPSCHLEGASSSPVPFNRRSRRRVIPSKLTYDHLNVWSFMKTCIGKDISKISMPVKFNEPLSMLQRVTEDYEYADLLHVAAQVTNPCEQLVYVAAFCISHYANSSRTRKPFNPLLGETFECDRSDDLGWKSIAEQVSHHPPMLAMHCEGRGWTCWSEFSISSKFRGKSLLVEPNDISHLEFTESGHHLTFRKVSTTIHNMIVGRPWVDNHGDMTIVNHTTGDECHVKFMPYSYFARDPLRRVTGIVVNHDGDAEWVLNGSWDNRVEASKVISSSRGSGKGKPSLETSASKLIWKKNPPIDDADKMYNLTLLAIQLNEFEDGVSPTDSRRRPDQRVMEEGNLDEANRIKMALEERQRVVRRKREEVAEAAAATGQPVKPYEPVWFERIKDPITGNPVYVSNGQYWDHKQQQDWSMCPSIFDYKEFLIEEDGSNDDFNNYKQLSIRRRRSHPPGSPPTTLSLRKE